MTNKTLEAIIASPPDREALVVQFFLKDGDQWAEMFFDEKGTLVMEIYPHVSGAPWVLNVNEVLHVINLSKEELSRRQLV